MQDTITATTIEIPARILCKALATVLPGRSKDKARPMLMAVHLRVRDKHLELTTTNSYIMHRLVLADELDAEPVEATLPAEWLEVWVKTKPTGDATLMLAETATLKVLNSTLESPILDGTFPDVDNLLALNKGEPGEAHLNMKYLGLMAKSHATWAGDFTPSSFETRRVEGGVTNSIMRTTTTEGELVSVIAGIRR